MAQEISFGDMAIETGPRISKFKFSKEEKNNTKRIFFNPKVWKDVAHFRDSYGYFRCLASVTQPDGTVVAGKCPACETGVKRDTRYGMHVLVYATDTQGNLKTPFSYEIMALIKSEKSFAQIYKLYQQYEAKDLFSHDFVINCLNVDFQQLSYNIDLKCVWMLQPNKAEILADIKAKVAEFDLSKIIAPEITLETMQALVDGKIPNRFATKNQPAAATVATEPAATTVGSGFGGSGGAGVAVAAAKPSATASDLDLLEQLSK
jgi:hypothetical protein